MRGRRWMIAALCLAAAAAAAVGVYALSGLRAQTEAAEVSAAFVTPSPTPTPTPEPAPTPTPKPTPEPEPTVELAALLDVDFDGLLSQNGDVYAWLDIPGTDISYPLLQSGEDNYYLMHNLDDSYGYPGCLYTNQCSAKDFFDFCTVIYGHNMADGSMFGRLHSLMFDEDALAEHPYVVIYTPDGGALVYRAAAAVVYDDRYIPDSFDFDTGEGRQAFIDSLRSCARVYTDDADITADSRLIVLSTCNGVSTSRDLVIAVYEGLGVPASEAG